MINALGKYSVKLRGDIRSISRLHPGGAPPEPRRAIGGCDFHLEAAGELMIEIDGWFLERVCTLLPNFASPTNPRVILCLLL